VREWYWQEREKLRAERRRRLEQIKVTCAERMRAVKERRAVDAADRKLRDHRQVRAALVAVRGGAVRERAELAREARHREREAREESDSRVRHEIEAMDRALLPVWDRVGKRIKAGPRKSRAETFFEWVEENPGEAIAIQSEAGDRDAERLMRDLAGRKEAHERAQRDAEIDALRVREGASLGDWYLVISRGTKPIGRVSYDAGTMRVTGWSRPPKGDEDERDKILEAARRYLKRRKAELDEVPF
jgi:hypothetical protein